MIKNFKKIKEIAVFKDFNWNTNLPNFKKYNAFYGWNGTGKTTVTRIFSAFEEIELGNLELEDNSECVIETDTNSTLKLLKDSHISDSLKNNIRVFNEDFVKKNLDWEQGKASPILIIGEEQIEQKEKLKLITKELEDINNNYEKKKREKENKDKEKSKVLENARDKIKEKLRNVNDVQPKSERATDYITYTIIDVENIVKSEETYIYRKEDEIMQLENSLKEKEAKELLNEIEVDLGWIQDIRKKSQELFKTPIPEEGVRLLDLEKIDEGLKDWLREGYEIHKDKQHPIKCEFCGNEISEKRLKELREYFSDVLRNLIKEIEQIIEAISSNQLPQLLKEKEDFYSEFQDEFLDLNNKFSKQVNMAREELNKIKNMLTQKKEKPSQEITFNFSILEKALTNFKNVVDQINSVIEKNNEKTNLFKERRTESAHKLELAIISEYKPDYKEKINAINPLEKEIESLIERKEELEEQQRELEQRLKKHYFAAEEFNKLLKAFMGRSEVLLEPAEEGYVIKRNKTNANNLSEGEQGAIALIYFLTKLKETNFDARKGIIVIDDPVSSFDSQHLYGAFSFIKEKIKELDPQQVFIFTHHFPFFRLIRDWMKHEKKNFSFYMIKSKINSNGRYSVIEKIDKLLEDYDSEYTYLFKLIYDRAQDGDNSLEKDYIFPNIIRKFLENYISFKIPLGGINIYEKFQQLCEDYPEFDSKLKTRIESYCQDQSHPLYQDSSTDFDERLLGEIQQVCLAIVDLINETDPKHYQHLLNVIKN